MNKYCIPNKPDLKGNIHIIISIPFRQVQVGAIVINGNQNHNIRIMTLGYFHKNRCKKEKLL